jgi:hypothetical protein
MIDDISGKNTEFVIIPKFDDIFPGYSLACWCALIEYKPSICLDFGLFLSFDNMAVRILVF